MREKESKIKWNELWKVWKKKWKTWGHFSRGVSGVGSFACAFDPVLVVQDASEGVNE